MKTKPSVMPLELNYKLSMTKKNDNTRTDVNFFRRHVIHVNPLPPGLLRQFFFCLYFFACSFVYFKFLILPNQKLICSGFL